MYLQYVNKVVLECDSKSHALVFIFTYRLGRPDRHCRKVSIAPAQVQDSQNLFSLLGKTFVA
jgi:hypothetical protein